MTQQVDDVTGAGDDPCVLVTNDDGPGAPGLAALARAATDIGWRVVLAAPAHDVSSTGTSMSAFAAGPVVARRRDDSWPGVLAGFEVEALPPTIVSLASMGAFGPPPTFVVAGVNHGLNVGVGLLHSSTVGAALTAAVHGLPGAAISAPRDADWTAWRPELARLLETLPGAWPRGVALNINLPGRPPQDGAAPVWCRPAQVTATRHLERTIIDDDEIALRVTYRTCPLEDGATDASVVGSGRIAMTDLWLPYATPADPAWRRSVSPEAA